jgi:hypothetical protein
MSRVEEHSYVDTSGASSEGEDDEDKDDKDEEEEGSEKEDVKFVDVAPVQKGMVSENGKEKEVEENAVFVSKEMAKLEKELKKNSYKFCSSLRKSDGSFYDPNKDTFWLQGILDYKSFLKKEKKNSFLVTDDFSGIDSLSQECLQSLTVRAGLNGMVHACWCVVDIFSALDLDLFPSLLPPKKKQYGVTRSVQKLMGTFNFRCWPVHEREIFITIVGLTLVLLVLALASTVYYKTTRSQGLGEFDSVSPDVDLEVMEKIVEEAREHDLHALKRAFPGFVRFFDDTSLYEVSQDGKTELRALLLVVAIAFMNIEDIDSESEDMELVPFLVELRNDEKYIDTIYCFADMIIGISEMRVGAVRCGHAFPDCDGF